VLSTRRWATRRRREDCDLLTTSSNITRTAMPEKDAADDRNEMYDAKRGTTISSSSSSTHTTDAYGHLRARGETEEEPDDQG
jgi:hypothetical protein